MIKELVVVGLILVIGLVVIGGWSKITGKIIGGPSEGMADSGMMGGPTEENIACMNNCYNIEGKSSDVCMSECGVEPQPEPADEGEGCMQQCIARGCDEEYDFNCRRANMQSCEDECGMKGDAPDESEMDEEQLCISNCVSAIDPTIICGAGKSEGEGEQGGEVCQRCAGECVHLYAGPCLTDELWREKEDECMAQGEHMESAPVKGNSGEGYECTVGIECIDRSGEWGDEPGEGPGIGQEGFVAKVGDAIGGFFEGVGNFFKGLFGGGGESGENVEPVGEEG